MTKKLFSPLVIRGGGRGGWVLITATMIIASVLVVLAITWQFVANSTEFAMPGEARKAAEVCMQKTDDFLGSVATDPYTGCTPGQFFVLNSTGGCADDEDTSDTVVAASSNCSCALMLSVANPTTYTVNAIGRCYKPGGTRDDNSYSEVIVQANVATGTPPCTPTCTPNSVAEFGDCSDGCGNACTDAVCQVGAKVLHCKANGSPPPTWACLQ